MARVPLHERLVRFVRAHPGCCAIVTGNLDVWIGAALARLPCPAWCSAARLRHGRVAGIRRLLAKEEVVKGFQRAGRQVVFVGDGLNDVAAMRQADVAIAACLLRPPAPALLEVADYVAFDEVALAQLLEALARQAGNGVSSSP